MACRIHGGTVVFCQVAGRGCCGRRGCGLWRCCLWGLLWCVVRCPRWLVLAVRCGVAWAVLGLAAPGRLRDMRGRDGSEGGCARVWALPALCPSPFWPSVSPACLPSVPLAVLSLLIPCDFPAPPLFCLFFFFSFFRVGDRGCLRAVLGWCGRCVCVWVGMALGVCSTGRGRGCVPVPVLAWSSWHGTPGVAAGSWGWVPWGMVVWRPLCFGCPVCVPVSGHPVAFGYRGKGQGVLAVGGQQHWWRGACVSGRGSRIKDSVGRRAGCLGGEAGVLFV